MRPDHQPPPQEPLRQGDSAWAITSSLVLTAVAVLTVELTDGTALRVIGLALMLLVAPFVAFRYGLRLGLLSTAVVVLYSIYYFSTPGSLFRYTDEDFRRLAALSVLALVLTVMVGALRHAVRATERQLRHQLGFANAITGSLGEGLYALDTRGRLTFMNPAAERILGWREEELLGKDVHEAIHTQHSEISRQGEDCPLLTVLRSSDTYRNDDDAFMARDGRRLPVAYTSSPIVTDGRVAGAVVAFHDITESKQAEEALRRSEERFRSLVQNSSDIVTVFDPEGTVLYQSPSVERVLGHRPEDRIGQNIFRSSLVHPDDLPQKRAFFKEVLNRPGENVTAEFRLKHANGTYHNIEAVGRNLLNDPNITGILATYRDVTESRRAEEALEQSEERLRAVVDNSTAIIYLKDTGGRYRLINRRFEELFHLSREQVVGKTDHDIFPEEVANAFTENDQKVLESGTPLELEEVAPQDDGLHTYISVKVPLKNAAGRPYAVCGISTDITRRKQAEDQREEMLAQVERALQLRGQFLSVASHELKTPVTLLKGYAQVLHQRAHREGDIQTLKPLRVMNRQVDRMTRLIDDLLDVSRIEGGKIRFEMEPFHLNQALGEVISEVRMTAPEFELRVEERASDLWVTGDRARIQQVLTNLLTNALKYSGHRKEVDVTIGREDDQALVAVTDYGIGIPEWQQPQVFELYFRGANAPTSNYGGLGLGLYISKGIVEQHGGTVDVVSEEDKGSTFSFMLPLVEPSPHAGAGGDPE